jgi:hypothetical protein
MNNITYNSFKKMFFDYLKTYRQDLLKAIEVALYSIEVDIATSHAFSIGKRYNKSIEDTLRLAIRNVIEILKLKYIFGDSIGTISIDRERITILPFSK